MVENKGTNEPGRRSLKPFVLGTLAGLGPRVLYDLAYEKIAGTQIPHGTAIEHVAEGLLGGVLGSVTDSLTKRSAETTVFESDGIGDRRKMRGVPQSIWYTAAALGYGAGSSIPAFLTGGVREYGLNVALNAASVLSGAINARWKREASA